LGAGHFAEMDFPVPPTEELQVIVDVVERQVSVWRTVVEEFVQRRGQSSSLRQSVLKAAFSGQLVPQDPADERAAALLARLAAGTHP
jgi:type I restriction enzyme S subunit